MANNKAVNIGLFMAQHLQKVAKADKGEIIIGGLITAITSYLGYDDMLADLPLVPGRIIIGIDACVHFRMIKLVAKGFMLLINGPFVNAK